METLLIGARYLAAQSCHDVHNWLQSAEAIADGVTFAAVVAVAVDVDASVAFAAVTVGAGRAVVGVVHAVAVVVAPADDAAAAVAYLDACRNANL